MWNEHLIDLNSFSNEIQIRFRAITNGSTNNEIDIDDFKIIEKPTCPNPTSITYNNITDTSVDLSWLSNGSESTWEIEYGNKDFSPNSGSKIIVNSNNYTLNNLSSNTTIDIYIKAICGNTSEENNSEQIGPITIKTTCSIATAPWYYDVELQNTNSIIENCWAAEPIINNTNYYWEAQYSTYNNTLTTGAVQI